MSYLSLSLFSNPDVTISTRPCRVLGGKSAGFHHLSSATFLVISIRGRQNGFGTGFPSQYHFSYTCSEIGKHYALTLFCLLGSDGGVCVQLGSNLSETIVTQWR
jgi:hypothetical protein